MGSEMCIRDSGVDEWYQKELEGQGYDDAKELIDTFTK